jgi:hyperosmotically inducible protein
MSTPLVAVVWFTGFSFAPQAVGDAEIMKLAAVAVRSYAHFSIFDDINLEVSGRVVTLTGRVTMPIKRDDIGARVAKIDGVDRVVNELQVLPASGFDARLRVRIAQAIYGHSAFWHYASMANPPIHIVVERSRVRLTGTVNNEVERMLAYALAQVDGVLSVTNELKIEGTYLFSTETAR